MCAHILLFLTTNDSLSARLQLYHNFILCAFSFFSFAILLANYAVIQFIIMHSLSWNIDTIVHMFFCLFVSRETIPL